MSDKNDFLIVALDYDSIEKALSLVDKLPSVTFYKVGMELFYSAGYHIIKTLKDRGKKIFLDLKINDIPKTIEKATRVISRLNVDYLTLFTEGEGVEAAKQASAGSCLKIMNVTVLTSVPTQMDLKKTLNVAETKDTNIFNRVKERTDLSLQAGADGVICSGLETLRLRESLGNDFIIINPGVRPAGFSHGDQQRVVTPSDAYRDGASHIVVGRPFAESDDPNLLAESIYSVL